MGDNGHSRRSTQAMSEEQLSALLAKLKDDAGLQEKLKGAADLDAAETRIFEVPLSRAASPIGIKGGVDTHAASKI